MQIDVNDIENMFMITVFKKTFSFFFIWAPMKQIPIWNYHLRRQLIKVKATYLNKF
jgi:hypothetical protein